MKKTFLATTALTTMSALAATGAMAAEAPEWKLSGNMNFQFYFVNQDFVAFDTDTNGSGVAVYSSMTGYTQTADGSHVQDHGWYFGVDEAELQLDVNGTADNGLNYGFKIEIQTNTTDGTVADEARIQLSGSWGTLQLGDEDGAEDIMNYGGENLMGATGGFDGDFADVLIRSREYIYAGVPTDQTGAALSYPTIIGDTGDATKVSYFSPRFSGFQVGASLTPTPNSGDQFKSDGLWENHIGIGANYDNSFGDLRIRASAVYSGASMNVTWINDVSAWSVGGIVGWGAFSLGANYTDNGNSWTYIDGNFDLERSYWDVAASFETGPMLFSVGYFSSYAEESESGNESTFTNIALTADYTLAPGLGTYAEVTMIDDDQDESDIDDSNSATIFIAGVNVSF